MVLFVPVVEPEQSSEPWWLWPNVLSLDAAAVAVVWQLFLAQSFRVELRWWHALILAGGVWLGYAGDRLLDARRLDPGRVATARHRFHMRHGRAMLLLWSLVVLALIPLSWVVLSVTGFLGGCGLVVVTVFYTLSAQRQRSIFMRWLGKEKKAALIFATGVFLFLFPRLEGQWAAGAFAFLLFAALCYLNCSLIALWERPVDAAQRQLSVAQTRPDLSRESAWLAWGVAACALLFLLVPGLGWGHRLALVAAFIVSSLGQWGLNRLRRQLSPEGLRVAVDLVLLFPALLLLL